jgi:hypothetical protein
MFNPEFDPFKMLNDSQIQTLQNSQNITKLAQAFNQRTELIDKLIDCFNQQDAKIRLLTSRVEELERRL